MKKSYIKPEMTTFSIEACHPLCVSVHEGRGDYDQLSVKPGNGSGGWDSSNWVPADDEPEAPKSRL